jgi:hypothetical protein
VANLCVLCKFIRIHAEKQISFIQKRENILPIKCLQFSVDIFLPSTMTESRVTTLGEFSPISVQTIVCFG